ncbi:MAG TPA: helix-turn-helix domain-containing protein [Candidatus Cloacimonadota bacterium]|nr:helix-turn-helix domain-containing protein [Candidatus Cloacimonadota bacterium]HPT72585.1 helix-turn-helix domain-containing protein [Candidatus Cloacimonadota bacterium]
MDTIGSYLKSLREAQHLTLDELQHETRMNVQTLADIEDDHLENIGGYGYARAIVYTVIRALNADKKKALALFDDAFPKEQTAKFKPRTPIKENKILISTNFLYLLGILLLIVVLGIIVIKAYQTYKQTPGATNSIFHRTKIKEDSVKTVPVHPVVVKPDTVRMKLIQVKKNVTNTPPATTTPKAKVKAKSAALADTTDYVNDLLFHNQENPLNIRN